MVELHRLWRNIRLMQQRFPDGRHRSVLDASRSGLLLLEIGHTRCMHVCANCRMDQNVSGLLVARMLFCARISTFGLAQLVCNIASALSFLWFAENCAAPCGQVRHNTPDVPGPKPLQVLGGARLRKLLLRLREVPHNIEFSLSS